jgi:hypothetical protein
MRPLGLNLGGRQVRKALAQQYFNGAQLGHGEANFTQGALMKPIDQLFISPFAEIRLALRSPRSRLASASKPVQIGTELVSARLSKSCTTITGYISFSLS